MAKAYNIIALNFEEFYDVSKAAVNNMRTSTTGNTVSKVIRDGKLTDNEYLNLTYEILPANEFSMGASNASLLPEMTESNITSNDSHGTVSTLRAEAISVQ